MISRRIFAVSLAVGALCLLAGSASFAKPTQRRLVSSRTAFTYSGSVLNKQGKPISGVEVTAIHQIDAHSLSYIDVVKTNAQGHFRINRDQALSGEHAADVTDGTIQLQFSHPDYAYAKLEDLRTFSPYKVTHLHVTLVEGRTVKGQVVNANRQMIVGASVEITFASDSAKRRGGTTDAQGRFTFRGLPGEAGTLHVLTVARDEPMLTAQAKVKATQTSVGTIVATPIVLSAGTVVHELFGMKLVDVDASLQAAFRLSRAGGVLVLDPGKDGHGLELQRGDQFFIVGSARIKDFAAFTNQLLTLRRTPDTFMDSMNDRVRVVWTFKRPYSSGTNTEYLKLDSSDVSELASIKKLDSGSAGVDDIRSTQQ